VRCFSYLIVFPFRHHQHATPFAHVPFVFSALCRALYHYAFITICISLANSCFCYNRRGHTIIHFAFCHHYLFLERVMTTIGKSDKKQSKFRSGLGSSSSDQGAENKRQRGKDQRLLAGFRGAHNGPRSSSRCSGVSNSIPRSSASCSASGGESESVASDQKLNKKNLR